MTSVPRKWLIVACFTAAAALSTVTLSWCAAESTGIADPTETKRDRAAPVNILPVPRDKGSPAPSEAVESAAQGLERKLHEVGTEVSRFLGSWIGSEVFFGLTWIGLIACLLGLFLVAVLDCLVRGRIKHQIRRLSFEKETTPWVATLLDAVSKPLSLFIWIYGAYAVFSILLVRMPEHPGVVFLRAVASRGADVGGSVAIIWLAYRLVVVSDVRTKAWAAGSQSGIDQLLVGIVGKTLRTAIVLLGGIMVVQSVTGIQMGPLIASLGLGGLAIALAAKESVANFLGTLTIIFDKPFRIGDQVIIDKYEGTVDAVGFRSTRIRTADGNLLSIPNSKVIDTPLQNVGQRLNIRWTADIGISYYTPPQKVSRALEVLEEILRDHEGMKEDLPPRIFLTGFKEWGFNINIQAWYHPPVGWDCQAWVQQICMRILERFDDEGIQFAMPAQNLRLPNNEKERLQLGALKREHTEPDASGS
jgi:MscS family membrane protein